VEAPASRGTHERDSGKASAIGRRPEIDYVKGLAIIFVFFIHAEPLRGSWFHEYVVNRAVPMFLVLFGLTSGMWWESRRSLRWLARSGQWYKGRFRRLLPPVWATLGVWWLLALWVPGYPHFSPRLAVANCLGYAPAIGTFWFVTLIFQLIILYPMLQAALDRFGAAPCLAFSTFLVVWSHLHAMQIMDALRLLLPGAAPATGLASFYYLWIFAPQYFWLVLAGMAATQCSPAGRGSTAVVFMTVVAASCMLHAAVAPDLPLAGSALQRLADVPLSFAALALFTLPRAAKLSGGWLSWCGRHSWGLYLAQMLVHDIAVKLGVWPGSLSHAERWCYLLFLFAASVAIVLAANAVLATARGHLSVSRLAPAFGSKTAARDRSERERHA